MSGFDWDELEGQFDDVDMEPFRDMSRPDRGIPWAADLFEAMDAMDVEFTPDGDNGFDQADWERRFGEFVDTVVAIDLHVRVLDEGSGPGSGVSSGEKDLADDAVVEVRITGQSLREVTNAAVEGRKMMQMRMAMMRAMLDLGQIGREEWDEAASVVEALMGACVRIEAVCQAIAAVGTGNVDRIA